MLDSHDSLAWRLSSAVRDARPTEQNWLLVDASSVLANISVFRANSYHHLPPSLKRDEFCLKFYFSNVSGLSGRVSLLTSETLAVMF